MISDDEHGWLDKAALIGLGSERLATILIEHAARDESLHRKLELALAGAGPVESLAADLERRIGALVDDESFVPYGASFGFADDLDALRRALAEDLLPKAPAQAADLLELFVGLHQPIFDRADDSSGIISDVFTAAVSDWAKAWTLLEDRDPGVLAKMVFHHATYTDYGILDGLVIEFGDALGTEGLAQLEAMLEAALAEPTGDPESYAARDKARVMIRGLLQIADLRGDVDAFIDLHRRAGTAGRSGLEIARRLADVQRYEEALEWIDEASHGGSIITGGEPVELKAACLEGLGRLAEAQEVRWRAFCRTLSSVHLDVFLAALPEDQRNQHRQQAIEVALAHDSVTGGLDLLNTLGATEALARLVSLRPSELNGDRYHLLAEVAFLLEPDHPREAIIVYRVLLDSILGRGFSKAYHHGARYLVTMRRLSGRVTDWQGLPPQEEYESAITQAHRRKHAFWARLAEAEGR